MDNIFCNYCGVSFQEARISKKTGNTEVFDAIRNEWTEECPECCCSSFVDEVGKLILQDPQDDFQAWVDSGINGDI